MSEYIVDESIIALLEDMLRTIESSDKWGYAQRYDGEIDFRLREKITRCRDCSEYTDEKKPYSRNDPRKTYCMFFSVWDGETGDMDYWYPDPDGFCKWGVSK